MLKSSHMTTSLQSKRTSLSKKAVHFKYMRSTFGEVDISTLALLCNVNHVVTFVLASLLQPTRPQYDNLSCSSAAGNTMSSLSDPVHEDDKAQNDLPTYLTTYLPIFKTLKRFKHLDI